jgi:hypothetical protein
MPTKITSPVKGLNERTSFGPFAVEFKNGVAETDETLPDGVKAYLERRKYTVEEAGADDGPFDPAKHDIAEVRAYLDGLDDSDPEARDAELVRVVDAEKAGKNRSTLLKAIEGVPATPTPPPADPQAPTGDQGDQGDGKSQDGGDDQ